MIKYCKQRHLTLKSWGKREWQACRLRSEGWVGVVLVRVRGLELKMSKTQKNPGTSWETSIFLLDLITVYFPPCSLWFSHTLSSFLLQGICTCHSLCQESLSSKFCKVLHICLSCINPASPWHHPLIENFPWLPKRSGYSLSLVPPYPTILFYCLHA